MQFTSRSMLKVLSLLALVLFSAAPGKACFSIVVGKHASKEGSVIVAHNEDDSGPQVVNHHKVPRHYHKPGTKVILRNGGQLDQVEWTWAYLWSEMPGMRFSDSFVNEWGVCVTSDNCPSREDRPEITDGGINAMLRHLVAQRARTAREGVQLAGQWVERFGYTDAGRTYVICDPEEGWLFCVVKGKHWLAQRVPDSDVAMVANTYTVRQVDVSDSANVLASEDIVSYASERRWYDPDSDGAFDFAAAYADPGSASHPSNFGRQWTGLDYVAAAAVPSDPDLPFSVAPKKKLCVTDIMQILRHKHTKTERCATGQADTRPTMDCSICQGSTQTSFVAQLRKDLPADMGLVFWMCLSQPETSVFIPYYFGISSFPPGFNTVSERPSQTVYNNKIKTSFQANPLEAFWTFVNFRDKVEHLPDVTKTRVLTEAQALEARALSMQSSLEEAAYRLYSRNRAEAAELLTNYSGGLYLSSLKMLAQTVDQPTASEQIMARARIVHERALTLDSHVDIPDDSYATEKTDPGIDHPRLKCDLVKMARGGLDAVFLAVYTGQKPELNEQGYKRVQEIALSRLHAIRRLAETMHPERCALARRADDLERIGNTGKKAIVIGMENGYPIGEDLHQLDRYYDLGVRYVTLSHIGNNQICDSSSTQKPLHNGLSAFGKQVVVRMNQLGMMCDVSHISVKSFNDVLGVTQAPVIASHSGCFTLHSHDRNLTDEQLRALSKHGGVIQIVALGGYLKAESPERKQVMRELREELGIPSWEERRKMSQEQRAAIQPKMEEYNQRRRKIAQRLPIATLTDYVNHIDHAVKIAGIDHVGIGTDFDGGGGVPGLNNHAEILNLTIELVRRGYSDEDICKIWGGNFLRVWRQVEAMAK
ncbi:membrane dipeptidase [Planctomycetota bacterium]